MPEEAKAGLARLAFGQAVCGTVAQTRRAMCAAGVQGSDDPKLRLVQGLGVRAYACFPLLAAGERPLGTLFFGSRRRDHLSEGDLAFLGAIARYVAVVRERLDAEAALRASEERLRLIVEGARDYAIFTTDPRDRIVDWAPGAAAVFGWSVEEAVGRPGAMLFTPEDREAGLPEREVDAARR